MSGVMILSADSKNIPRIFRPIGQFGRDAHHYYSHIDNILRSPALKDISNLIIGYFNFKAKHAAQLLHFCVVYLLIFFGVLAFLLRDTVVFADSVYGPKSVSIEDRCLTMRQRL